MKRFFYFIALCSFYLIPACGGKAEDDSLGETGAISSVAGSSSQDETGGASNTSASTTATTSTGGMSSINSTSILNATGGSTSKTETGGTSAVQNTASSGGENSLPTTGGSNSIGGMNFTGGNSTATNATATPEICNDGVDNDYDGLIDCRDSDCANNPSCVSTSTGGASSLAATGGSNSTGGSASNTGGSSSTECKPELHIVLLSQNTATVAPGAIAVQTLKLSIEALCVNMEIARMDFDISAPDFDISDSRPFWHTTVDGMVHNLTNAKLIDDKTGATLNGPIETEFYSSNQQAHLAFKDRFPLWVNTPITATVTHDVSPEFNSPLSNTRYMVGFSSASTSDATIPLVVSAVPDFPYTASTSSFTVSNPNGKTNIILEYGEDPVPQNIVVPNKNRSPIITTNYLVWTEGPLDERVSDITIEQTNPNGKLTDCSQIIASLDAKTCATVDTVGLPLTQQSLSVHLSEATCGKIIKPNQYTTTDLEIRCVVADPIQTSLAQSADPKSGDIFALKVTSVTASDGGNGVIIKHQAHSMVLHKSAPIITWLPVTEPLHVGKSKIASLVISGSSDLYPLAFQQLSFNVVSAKGAQFEKTASNSYGAEDLVYVNGQALASAAHVSDGQSAYVYMKFVDGDHLTTDTNTMTLDLYANVTAAPSGSGVQTMLRYMTSNADTYSGFMTLVGIGFPGQIEAWKTETQQNVQEATMFWSDLSAGTEHVGFNGTKTSGDFLTGYLVTGTDGRSTVTAP